MIFTHPSKNLLSNRRKTMLEITLEKHNKLSMIPNSLTFPADYERDLNKRKFPSGQKYKHKAQIFRTDIKSTIKSKKK